MLLRVSTSLTFIVAVLTPLGTAYNIRCLRTNGGDHPDTLANDECCLQQTGHTSGSSYCCEGTAIQPYLDCCKRYFPDMQYQFC